MTTRNEAPTEVSVLGAPDWMRHINERLSLYRSTACPELEADMQIVSADLVIAGEWSEAKMLEFPPADRIVESIKIDGSRWQRRPDFYTHAAQIMIARTGETNAHHLFSLAEYARPGDGSLQSRSHIVREKNVFLTADTSRTTASEVATVLRQSRSSFTLGMIGSVENDPCALDETRIFFTDAFEGDAILLCGLGVRK